MAQDVDLIGLAKALVWEETKGHLRALVAASGQTYVKRSPDSEKVRKVVEAFIKDFEDNGYHE